VAIIAAIALTCAVAGTKHQDPARQVMVRREDRVRLVKVPPNPRTSSNASVISLDFSCPGAVLFCISVAGIFINRKNVIVLLMAIELMLLCGEHELRRVLALPRQCRGPGVRVLHPDRGRGRVRHRPCHPGGAVPQPRTINVAEIDTLKG
jgi:NADH-quinone oxidoreductase subunit K